MFSSTLIISYDRVCRSEQAFVSRPLTEMFTQLYLSIDRVWGLGCNKAFIGFVTHVELLILRLKKPNWVGFWIKTTSSLLTTNGERFSLKAKRCIHQCCSLIQNPIYLKQSCCVGLEENRYCSGCDTNLLHFTIKQKDCSGLFTVVDPVIKSLFVCDTELAPPLQPSRIPPLPFH